MTKVIILSLALVGVAAVVPGSEPARISAAVAIPADRASNWVSVTHAEVRRKSLPLGARRWFDDTVNAPRRALPRTGQQNCFPAACCGRVLAKEAYATTWQEEGKSQDRRRITKECGCAEGERGEQERRLPQDCRGT